MHWLQTLDTSLFFFINRSLVNPFFDWLMPVLSGSNGVKTGLIAAAIAAGMAMIVFGGRRGRLCVLLLILIVATNDQLICNTIKHAVARPRPFVTLPEARVFGHIGQGYVPPEINEDGADMAAGKGNHNSMPSSHAANLFAATMVLFLFYRKSLWFMLPLALGVAFSRVYNGVHYPGDVLAGAILGAGDAVAFAVALEAAWQFAGKKWFPLWHAQLPSLLKPEVKIQNFSKSEIGNRKSEIEWLHLGCVFIVVTLFARWLYLASGVIELSNDEAYQWLWSKHLALSYYSKPPGIALIQFAGTSLWGDTEFGVRFFSPLFAAILSGLVLRLLAREAGARAGFLLLLIVTAVPLFAAGALLMTIDPPLVLCWMWALVAGWRAAQPDGRTRDWLVVGLAMGLGFLCKYSAAYQIVCWAVFFAMWPAARVHLRKPGPWLALLIFVASTLPVVIWNWQHGWITIRHVAANAGLDSPWKFSLRPLANFLAGECGLLNPVFFLGCIWAMCGFWKFRCERPLWLYFFCMSAPVLLGHLLYSLHSEIKLNWIAPAVPPVFCLMVVYWREKLRAGSRLVKPALAAGLALGFAFVALMYAPDLAGKIAGQPLPGEIDPSSRVRAWRQTAGLAETAREKLAAEGKPAFIIANHYDLTGLFSFYSPPARAALNAGPLVYCVDSDEPKNQFYFWPEYDYRTSRKGQNAIYVVELPRAPLEKGWVWKWLAHQPVDSVIPVRRHAPPPQIAGEFETVTDLGEHEVKIGDRTFHRVRLWSCYNLR